MNSCWIFTYCLNQRVGIERATASPKQSQTIYIWASHFFVFRIFICNYVNLFMFKSYNQNCWLLYNNFDIAGIDRKIIAENAFCNFGHLFKYFESDVVKVPRSTIYCLQRAIIWTHEYRLSYCIPVKTCHTLKFCMV